MGSRFIRREKGRILVVVALLPILLGSSAFDLFQ